jgi:hypothetical protein
MSLRHTNWVYANASRYRWGCGLQLVLLSLADQMNQYGECWPSHQHTANRVGLSEKQVRRHVTKLKSLGLITVIKNEKGGKPGNTPTYRATFDVSNDAKGKRAPSDGSPTTTSNVQLQALRSPRGLPSTSVHPSHQREPNHHRTINESTNNQEAYMIKNTMPLKLDSWEDHLLAGKLLGLTIREYDPIESDTAFCKRVKSAHKDFWGAGTNLTI